MKAALNGVPSLSILDGWWIEGCIEGVTGWAIGRSDDGSSIDAGAEARSMYDKLENEIVPMFYRDETRYADIMRWTIAINASFFHTQRMLRQYIDNAYVTLKSDLQRDISRIHPVTVAMSAQ